MIHCLADVHSDNIGKNTTIWQFSVVLENAVIGDDCNINCHTFIEGGVKIGNRVTVKSGIFLWEGITIEDDVFLGPNVVFTNDLLPRSKKRVQFSKTLIKKGASIGANTSILAGVTVGKYAMVGMASVVTKDIPAYGLYYGHPAKHRGWVDEQGRKLSQLEENIFTNSDGDKFTLVESLKLVRSS